MNAHHSLLAVIVSVTWGCANPLVTLPSLAPCLEAPNIDPCSIALNVGEGVRLQVETSDIVWLRIHEADLSGDGLELVRLSIEQLEPARDGSEVEVRMHAMLYPAGAGNESIPGWRPGPSAAAVRPWRPTRVASPTQSSAVTPWPPPDTMDALVYFDLLGHGAISLPGPGEGWLLVLEILDGSAELEVTAGRVSRDDVIRPQTPYKPPQKTKEELDYN